MNYNIQHYAVSSLLHLPQMDLDWHQVMELIQRLFEAELGKKRERTRVMEERLRADIAALDAKENERLMLASERDQKLAVKKAVDKLVSEFLQAEGNKNFDAQKAMEKDIVALMSPDGGDGGNTGGSDSSVNGVAIMVGKDGDGQ
ncbi:uncharacterized protein LOC120154975 [Hibiscus syriacus]|uniref:uncharacterized protein LOC120154975 n=1 Tax=Hibiscus syriacus TaxID=106335 RepID=UPI00192223F2|nr:uncharacterized protein LOC120154975 [Hibiscus syriacus]